PAPVHQVAMLVAEPGAHLLHRLVEAPAELLGLPGGQGGVGDARGRVAHGRSFYPAGLTWLRNAAYEGSAWACASSSSPSPCPSCSVPSGRGAPPWWRGGRYPTPST